MVHLVDEVVMVAAGLIVEAIEVATILQGAVTVVVTGDGRGAMRHTKILGATYATTSYRWQ